KRGKDSESLPLFVFILTFRPDHVHEFSVLFEPLLLCNLIPFRIEFGKFSEKILQHSLIPGSLSLGLSVCRIITLRFYALNVTISVSCFSSPSSTLPRPVTTCTPRYNTFGQSNICLSRKVDKECFCFPKRIST